MTPSIRFPRRAWGALVLAGAVLFLSSCSGGKPSGTVTGTVKYKGAPLTIGTVNFYDPARGTASPGELDAGGNFKLQGSLEAGMYKVYIQAPIPEQLPPGQVSKRPKFDLPPKYQDPGQTTVSKEVKAGANTIPIDLE